LLKALVAHAAGAFFVAGKLIFWSFLPITNMPLLHSIYPLLFDLPEQNQDNPSSQINPYPPKRKLTKNNAD
jgi:hypothetical protein